MSETVIHPGEAWPVATWLKEKSLANIGTGSRELFLVMFPTPSCSPWPCWPSSCAPKVSQSLKSPKPPAASSIKMPGHGLRFLQTEPISVWVAAAISKYQTITRQPLPWKTGRRYRQSARIGPPACVACRTRTGSKTQRSYLACSTASFAALAWLPTEAMPEISPTIGVEKGTGNAESNHAGQETFTRRRPTP